MLLAHQVGSVKIGEVVRYTVTYTPSHDRILPSPECLYLRIKNTSNIALRAAFVHGPYTLSVAAYPANFDPNRKFENPRRYGVPEFEPMLKAGGSWSCPLIVPDNIRQTAGTGAHGYFGSGPEHNGECAEWVIEVASQVLFSTSAAVQYEILLARDEKSLNLGSAVPVLGGSQAQPPQPGRVSDFPQGILGTPRPDGQKGVFSRAVHLRVEDTAALWNKPQLPGWDEVGWRRARDTDVETVPGAPVATVVAGGVPPSKRQKKVHLVVLSHGLHSNLGADMLFIKESIDAGVRQAKLDAKERRAKERAARRAGQREEPEKGKKRPSDGGSAQDAAPKAAEEDGPGEEESADEDDEEVIVRGFSGNATKTERGVKYLGKRLARYILSMTYPDQPFLPTAKAASEAITHTLKSTAHKNTGPGAPVHKHSTIHAAPTAPGKRLYKITKISFVAHSLGGLIQTYAVAYIQKHSPKFFDLIEPINFIALASPFLGLNHENPIYVNFALDFGLVGRTGQDLGLTWRAPTLARSGWGAIVSNLGENAHKHVYGETQPESKPLLRILPTGPAHTALKKFRNRTVYSNVVNDGIVPLRTSCLLFLDWQGLGRVEKARREAGLVETVVGFGWAELTGANMTSPRIGPWSPAEEAQDGPDAGKSTPPDDPSHEVPQPPSNATRDDDQQTLRPVSSNPYPSPELTGGDPGDPDGLTFTSNTQNNVNPFTGFFNFFRKEDPPKSPPPATAKQKKIYQRSQTLRLDEISSADSSSSKSRVTSGVDLTEGGDGVSAPPRTSFFESAGDLLNPKLPSIEYLIDPSKRPRTIFHDRIYHPTDIPPPPLKRRPTGAIALRRKSFSRTGSSANTHKSSKSESSSPFPSPHVEQADSGLSQRDYDDTTHTNPDKDPNEVIDSSQMKVEEKIARAYHRDLSWRKVLVKLEPDAHNNIIVRRTFANAFGWPVVHHLVESHFSDSATARTRDERESSRERAKGLDKPPGEDGEETKTEKPRDGSETREERAETPTKAKKPGRPADRLKSEERTASEAREALDAVPDLPRTPKVSSEDRITRTTPSSSGSPSSDVLGTSVRSSPRPHVDRLDSVTWSDRDWADSGEESDSYGGESRRASYDHRKEGAPAGDLGLGLSGAGPSSPVQELPLENRSPSPFSGAYWAEKFSGKGPSAK